MCLLEDHLVRGVRPKLRYHIGRWVLVTVSGGRMFYGVLGIGSGDRKKDVVLYRPMPYDPEKGTYQFTGNKAILP